MAAARPGVLGGGVQGGAGEVEADADQLAGPASRHEALGLEPGQQAQRLGVALEAAAVLGELVERLFAVVPEGRVAQVVGEAGGLDEVGVAAEGRAELPADLGALQGVGEPGAGAGVPGRGCAVPGVTTWVLPASRRSAAECSTRARSRWKAVRPGRLSGSGAQRSVSAAS